MRHGISIFTVRIDKTRGETHTSTHQHARGGPTLNYTWPLIRARTRTQHPTRFSPFSQRTAAKWRKGNNGRTIQRRGWGARNAQDNRWKMTDDGWRHRADGWGRWSTAMTQNGRFVFFWLFRCDKENRNNKNAAVITLSNQLKRFLWRFVYNLLCKCTLP